MSAARPDLLVAEFARRARKFRDRARRTKRNDWTTFDRGMLIGASIAYMNAARWVKLIGRETAAILAKGGAR